MLSKFLRTVGSGGLAFWCPGCNESHVLWIKDQPFAASGPSWTWNRDTEKPVFSPSVLVTSGHYCIHWMVGQSCWCTYNREQKEKGKEPAPWVCVRCHSFVGCNGAEPGQIVFLPDSTHRFAGQVLTLPEFPAHFTEHLDKD